MQISQVYLDSIRAINPNTFCIPEILQYFTALELV